MKSYNIMKEFLNSLLKNTPLYYPLRNWWLQIRNKRELRDWEKRGRQVPPPHIVKQSILKNYAKKYNLKILVETGTYYGDMVWAMKNSFARIYSIELSQELFKKAKNRYKSDKHIELIHGDSSKELVNVIKRISQPALFWLDGHYSGEETARGETESPVLRELNQIFDAPDLGHVIIIDDARCFGADSAYPTIEELKDYILSKRANVRIVVENDTIRIIPCN